MSKTKNHFWDEINEQYDEDHPGRAEAEAEIERLREAEEEKGENRES